MMKIDIAFLPTELENLDLSDIVCIMLDIFRASTTIVTALQNGCEAIVPVASIEEAHSMAAELHPVLLAGERQSIKIEGFDFGNSPLEFSKEKVHAKTIVMSTSNGTRAIKVTEGSYRSFVGSFRNAAALCQLVKSIGKDVCIVCAGTEGYFSLEDALCAGLLAERLMGVSPVDTSDKVQAAILMYQSAIDSLTEVTGKSRNGQRLHKLGMSADVEFCLQLDQLDLIPEYRNGKIKALRLQAPSSS